MRQKKNLYNTGQIIRDMRERCGMTQNELAQAMGMSPGYIRAAESRDGCTFETMADYAAVMGYEIVFRRKK